jgi:hypothetical protein
MGRSLGGNGIPWTDQLNLLSNPHMGQSEVGDVLFRLSLIPEWQLAHLWRCISTFEILNLFDTDLAWPIRRRFPVL